MKTHTLRNAINRSLRVHYIPKGGALRFQAFLKWLLEDDDIPLSLHFYLCLFGFDGLTLDHAELVFISQPCVWKGHVCLRWKSKDERQQRIILSAISLKLLGQIKWGEIQAYDIQDLRKVYSQFAGHSQTLDAFTSDQRAWFSEHFSGPIFEHLVGKIPMTALSDSALAREHSKQALKNENVEQGDADFDSSLMGTITGFLEPIGNDRNQTAVDELVSICRFRKGKPNHLAKQIMIKECLGLAPQANKYGPNSSLLLSWAVDLINSGTQKEPNLSQSAIANYVSISRMLFIELRGKDAINLSAEEYLDLYQKIISDISPGQKKIASSALRAFHRFLINWFDVPAIRQSLQHDNPESLPRANIIWLHEIEQILIWLDSANCDERLVQFWRVAILIAFESRIRITELLYIRVDHISVYHDVIEIKIESSRSGPSIKSDAARRTLHLHDQRTISALTALLERRTLERAFPSDLLFGDTTNPRKIYSIGQFYFGLNQLLKSATGDKEVSYHSLSHTVISVNLKAIIGGGGTQLINPLAQFATNAAHYSIMTTCSVYMHLFEEPVRWSLDRAMMEIQITSAIAARWSGDSSASIRKRVSRGAGNKQIYWDTIFTKQQLPKYPCVANYYETEVPLPPLFLFAHRMPSYVSVLNTLVELAGGLPVDAVASRLGCGTVEMIQLIKAARDVIFQNRLDNKINWNASVEESINTIKRLEKIGIDFTRVGQPKFTHVKQYLSSRSVKDFTMLKRAFVGWFSLLTRKYGYISLRPDSETLNFLKFLKEGGVEITHLCMFCSEPDDSEDYLFQQSSIALRKLFTTIFSITPAIYKVASRIERPQFYLGITLARATNKKPPHPAATSVAGLNAILFALTVWMEWRHE